MLPEDQLDALLSARLGDNGQRLDHTHALDTDESTWVESQAQRSEGDPEMYGPQLEAARRLTTLNTLSPSQAFASALEERFLAYIPPLEDVPVPLIVLPPSTGGDVSGLPGPASRASQIRIRRRWPQRLLAPLAAALTLVFLSSVLAAAAFAGPGAPLYGIHRWEQNVRVNFAANPADATRLHLQYASDALGPLASAARQPIDVAAYHDALHAVDTELTEAAASLNAVPRGQTRDQLSASMDTLRAEARSDLYGALPALGWDDRLRTTVVLGRLGAGVPLVTQAVISWVERDGATVWNCTLSGSGFAPGAVLLVNGQPVDALISVSANTVVAEVAFEGNPVTPHTLGLGNHDGTAAVTTKIVSRDASDDNSVQPANATPDDHGGSTQPGNGEPTGASDVHSYKTD